MSYQGKKNIPRITVQRSPPQQRGDHTSPGTAQPRSEQKEPG